VLQEPKKRENKMARRRGRDLSAGTGSSAKSQTKADVSTKSRSSGSCCKIVERGGGTEGGWEGGDESQLAHCPSDGASVFLLQNVQLISSANLLQRIVSKLINLQL
jgi:hypothetical protein